MTFILYIFGPNTKERGVTLALCSSVVKFIFTTCGMVENVSYTLGAIACSLAYQTIDIASTDGVV